MLDLEIFIGFSLQCLGLYSFTFLDKCITLLQFSPLISSVERPPSPQDYMNIRLYFLLRGSFFTLKSLFHLEFIFGVYRKVGDYLYFFSKSFPVQ